MLRRLNPSLLPSVWNGSRHVPRGFEFRVPAHRRHERGRRAAVECRALRCASGRYQHRVRSGETLSAIATRYGVGMTRIAELNGLRRPYRIHAGQVLTLPTPKPAQRRCRRASAHRRAQAEQRAAGTEVAAPTGVVGTENRYVVKRGDTLSTIATEARHDRSRR